MLHHCDTPVLPGTLPVRAHGSQCYAEPIDSRQLGAARSARPDGRWKRPAAHGIRSFVLTSATSEAKGNSVEFEVGHAAAGAPLQFAVPCDRHGLPRYFQLPKEVLPSKPCATAAMMKEDPSVLQKMFQQALAACNQNDLPRAEQLCRQVIAAQSKTMACAPLRQQAFFVDVVLS